MRFGVAPWSLAGVQNLNISPCRSFDYKGKQYVYAGPYVFIED